MADLKELFPVTATQEIPGPMLPLYANLRLSATAYAQAVIAVCHNEEISNGIVEEVKTSFDAAAVALSNWKPK